jgi:predicted P-loop ATPase
VDKSKEFSKAPVKEASRDIGRLIEKFCLNEKVLKEELIEYLQIFSDNNSKGGGVNIGKVEKFLNDRYDFRYNIVLGNMEVKLKSQSDYVEMDDRAYWTMYHKLDRTGLRIAENRLRGMLTSEDFSGDYHPLKEYINGLPEWDKKKDYIKEFITQIKLEDESKRPYLEECFKRWCIGAVVGWFEDEVDEYKVNQTCLVFVGNQGVKKTTWFGRLIPKHLRLKYYKNGYRELSRNDKEAELPLATKMIINLDELQSMNKADIEDIKNVITKAEVNLRRAYGRMYTYLKRRASFVASINREEFLSDITGTRRFLTFYVDSIAVNESLNVDNVYAQAFYLYKQKEKFWFDPDEIKEVEKENDRFKLKTLIEEMHIATYKVPSKEEINALQFDYVTSSQVSHLFAQLEPRLNINNSVTKEIGMIFKARGFEKKGVKENGTTIYKWKAKKMDKAVVTELDGSELKNDDFIF